ncbi:fructose-specific PTS transporter subunit EIIC [Mollicutes bacterium LVI A0039]|nr:fructose-specific PTS transporter subunit EIIC [Mollicutes bacterium LVI A0039]
MLTSKEYIIEDKTISTKEQVFARIAKNLVENGFTGSESDIINKLNEREAMSSTGFEQGIAIPHAKVEELANPIITVVKSGDIKWPSMDGNATNLILCILVPTTSSNDHLQILGALTRKLIDPAFVEELKASGQQQVVEMINNIDVQLTSTVTNVDKVGSFVAITSCPMGVAHTYMAAESLEQTAASLGYQVKVETQGTVGVENKLSSEDIANADFVIIAADRNVELDRFGGKKVLETSTKNAISNAEKVIERAKTAPVLEGKAHTEKKSGGNEIMKALMNGVSHMLPLVVVGGLFLGLALGMGGVATDTGLVIPDDSFWKVIENIGAVGFTLMIPVLAGYIAYALGDRPALAPGLIIGWIANNGSFYGSEASTGFIGAIIGGIMVGYFVRYFARIRLPKNLQSVMPILIIPLVTTFVTSTVFILFLGRPIASAFLGLQNWLASFSPEQMVIMGLVLGFMIAIDMGGPINKTAMLFAIGMISTGHPEYMGMNGVAVATPSIGIGLATMLRPKYYTQDERGAGTASAIMGCVGITEGAIPFAAAHPKEVFPANLIGAMVGGAIAAYMGIENIVPHGGFVIALTGGINKPLIFCVAIIIGALVTALIANLLMSRKYKKNNQ